MDLSGYDLNGLHLLHKSISELSASTESEMHIEEDLHSANFKELSEKLFYYSALLEMVIIEIRKRQKDKLLFSVEDMFRMVGQFDKYVIIYFYHTSDSYINYGEEVHGHIIYGRKSRSYLTETIVDDNHTRSDGKILLDTINIDEEKIKKLKTDGFLASEIYKIETFNHDPEEVAYKKQGLKTIPNTIEIPFESAGFDLARVENHIISMKISDGYKILAHEMLRYYVNELIIGNNVPEELLNKYVIEDNGVFKEQALVQMNSYALHHDVLDEIQKSYFNIILGIRAERRIELLKKDLGITNDVFEKFKINHPSEYRNTRMMLMSFREETLTNTWPQYPIYWDEERFIHIYGRHYVDYFINFSTYNGTHFQYTYKDIRRLICLVLDSLREDIESSLSNGKRYDKYGDQGYYFNGDYYTLRIDETGRLMTFFPMGKPKA
ncbi:hypothetical protein EZ428_09295 [Pedobacter frigiditerrae]|uniref:Uncharacterized protein n=1 Tax=Pedobacter frigiditerrae TaxID=2530452 RepID=A0A4R0N0R4_9SPHI|nr:hypothetical protein [Pedobacter frigiditerrae]TCC91932.1 hypothetical protein EZ428_09295 [Pedobacter frigiditerrae]